MKTLTQKTAHTPGPWIVTAHTGSMAVHAEYIPDGEIARISDQDTQNDGGNSRETMLANARLIAAAPELLAELKRWVRYMNRDCAPDYGATAEKLIARIEGR